MQPKIKNKIYLAVVVFFLVSFAVLFAKQRLYPLPVESRPYRAQIGQTQISLTIADTAGKREQGLSGQVSLPADWGMLFVFPDYAERTFWMAGMKFPLDIIWLKDNTVVGFTTNLPPPADNSQPAQVTSAEAVNAVLEVNAGFVEGNSIKIGDTFKLLTE